MKKIKCTACNGDNKAIQELALVGADIGGGFKNAQELHVVKCKEAMAGPKKDEWDEAVKDEHDRMTRRHKVFKGVPRSKVPKGAKTLTAT